ncbi:integral membrane protein [Methylobacterium indicum]|uniref:DUF1254 domain-containing protein n=1 Tax=Methylobacterium indicum TaxID=1775910 RepID=A0A0J6RAZ1_9HYPH|nr:integral membrane protein [Methylobacterium indicum]KMO18472.1 integral membrane protein [Methylobacterium indicum]KMO24757.1 integral membrane protein [Methylobacterium indicum]KTS21801.1 integral membrane protein [Methylobacterium indicum]KTS25390.1 integral membrane protein [Methylobacterium indicum]KTS52936.1 integral membrane protein [Methylobacterium indicum]
MTPFGRFLLATLCGLVLAGLVHVAAVLAIPYLATGDALSQARATLANDTSVLVHAVETGGKAEGAPAAGWLPRQDPAVAVGICAYDLDDGPVRITAETGPLLETIALHGRNGAYYAITDQAALRGTVELVIMTKRQYDEALASADEDERNRDMRIVAPSREGFVSIRVLAALPSQQALANEAARSVSCTIDGPDE